MKIRLFTLLFLSTVLSSLLWANSPKHSQLKAFPEAKDGEVRHVIVVPKADKEQDLKVELLIGKVVLHDGVNQVGLGGTVTKQTVQGWGYPSYQVEFGGMMSTLMAPMEGAPKVERFVHLPGKLIRYNSRLPIVIYAPPGSEVRYRIWTAGKTQTVE